MVVDPADLLDRVIETGGDQHGTQVHLEGGLGDPGRAVRGAHGQKVETASTKVPRAVANDATVAQSVSPSIGAMITAAG